IAVVDRAVRRVLEAKARAGLLDHPLSDEKATISLDRDAARRVAQRSIILLKNDGDVLPLSRSKKIAVVGPLANSKPDMLGPWAAQGKAEDVVTVLDAISSVPVDQADVIVAILGETREMSGEASSRSSLD